MTLYELKNFDSQDDTVFAKGKFIGISIDGNNKYVLYALDKFFAEVECDIEQDEIIGKGVFKEGDSLDKYSNVPKEI